MKPTNFLPTLRRRPTFLLVLSSALLAGQMLIVPSIVMPSAVAQTAQPGKSLSSQAASQTDRPKYPNYPSETPAELKPATSTFDHERREVMIAMRDGVKLHTVILVPRGAAHAPMLLTRTPYDASALTTHM